MATVGGGAIFVREVDGGYSTKEVFIPPSLGEVIQGSLQDRRVSEMEFAERTGLSSAEIALLLSGKGRLTNDLYAQIEPVFPCMRSYMFNVQTVHDYFERYGYLRPQGMIARIALALYSRLTRW